MAKEKYSSYKQIARKAGITVPKLKQILTKKKYVVKTEATKKALDAGLAIKIETDPDHYLYNPSKPYFFKWSEERALRILKRSGESQDPRYRVHNMHNMGDRMVDLAEACARHMGYTGNGGNFDYYDVINEKMGKRASGIAHQSADVGFDFICDFDSLRRSNIPFSRMGDRYEAELAAIKEAYPEPSKHIDDAEMIWKGIKEFAERQIKV